MSNSSKVNRITTLTERIDNADKEIGCANVMTKIVYLYLQEVAIPFFRHDKLGVYNGAVNLYAQKMINNSMRIQDYYQQVLGSNQLETSEAVGNITILEDGKKFNFKQPG